MGDGFCVFVGAILVSLCAVLFISVEINSRMNVAESCKDYGAVKLGGKMYECKPIGN